PGFVPGMTFPECGTCGQPETNPTCRQRELSRGQALPVLVVPGLRQNRRLRRAHSARRSSMASIEELAVQRRTMRVAIQPLAKALLQRFLCFQFQLRGFLQSLFSRLELEAKPLGPRLGALLLALSFARVAFAADRLQISLEVIGAVIVVDLFARGSVLDGADNDLALARHDVRC